jgi:hypothetical protein
MAIFTKQGTSVAHHRGQAKMRHALTRANAQIAELRRENAHLRGSVADAEQERDALKAQEPCRHPHPYGCPKCRWIGFS